MADGRHQNDDCDSHLLLDATRRNIMQVIQKITPCLWFDDQAEEAVKFYTVIFRNSKIEILPVTEKLDERSTGNRRDR